MFGKSRTLAVVVACAFLLAAVALAAFYIIQPRATLRITSGPEGTQGHRFISAFIKVVEARYPHVRFETVMVPNLTASAKALENGDADIAVIRSDVALPANGETLVILRRDAFVVLLPHGSDMDSLDDLAGKTVAIAKSNAQDDNSRALDTLLGYYDVAPAQVKRVFMAAEDIGPALAKKHIAAAIAVGPIGPGDVVDTVASIIKATKNAPDMMAFDDADAIVKRFPQFESLDVPKGAFKPRPQVPDDEVTTIAVNYRFAVPITMIDIVADALGRSILSVKSQLMSVLPIASQIEAPDVNDLNPLLPIHPGFAAYLNNGDQSFFDQAERYLYLFGIPISIGASLITVLLSMFAARGMKREQRAMEHLLEIAREAKTADRERLDALEGELHAAVANYIAKSGEEDKAAQWKAQLAVQHAMRGFERRDAILREEAARAAAVQQPGSSAGQTDASPLRRPEEARG